MDVIPIEGRLCIMGLEVDAERWYSFWRHYQM